MGDNLYVNHNYLQDFNCQMTFKTLATIVSQLYVLADHHCNYFLCLIIIKTLMPRKKNLQKTFEWLFLKNYTTDTYKVETIESCFCVAIHVYSALPVLFVFCLGIACLMAQEFYRSIAVMCSPFQSLKG